MNASHYRVRQPCPELGVLPGELVRYDPGQPFPIEIIRCKDVGALAGFWQAVATGRLERLDQPNGVLELAEGAAADGVVGDVRPPMHVVRATA